MSLSLAPIGSSTDESPTLEVPAQWIHTSHSNEGSQMPISRPVDWAVPNDIKWPSTLLEGRPPFRKKKKKTEINIRENTHKQTSDPVCSPENFIGLSCEVVNSRGVPALAKHVGYPMHSECRVAKGVHVHMLDILETVRDATIVRSPTYRQFHQLKHGWFGGEQRWNLTSSG